MVTVGVKGLTLEATTIITIVCTRVLVICRVFSIQRHSTLMGACCWRHRATCL